ncbi:MAG: restriction endonuclease subunit S, partial [Prochlorotrichaceae cyanobacterium]
KKGDRQGGKYPVFGSGGIIGTHDKFLVEAPGIIVGRKGSIGNVFWTDKNYYPIDTTYFINKEQSSLFLYHSLQNIGFINTDVAVPGLNRDFAHSRELTMPKKQILDLFHEFVDPLYEQISKLNAINQKLQQARDLLLPRLMNGEITV